MSYYDFDRQKALKKQRKKLKKKLKEAKKKNKKEELVIDEDTLDFKDY